MSVYHKTPMACRAARSYCRRCLAVMLCCVLVFGLTVRVTPRANAATVDGTSAVEILGGPNLTVIKGGASGGSAPASSGVTGSTFGAFLLAASGLNILADSIDYTTTRYYGGTAYEKGNELWSYLWDLGGDIGAWCMGVDSRAQDAGGIQPGDSYTIPAEVLEAVRQWAVSNIDFTDGAATYTQGGIFAGDTQLVFTSYPSGYKWNNVPFSAVSLGTVVPYGASFSATFSDAEGVPVTFEAYLSYLNERPDGMIYKFMRDGSVIGGSVVSYGDNSLFFHLREIDGRTFLVPGILYPNGTLQFDGYYWNKLRDFQIRYPVISVDSVVAPSTTFMKTPDFDEEKTEDIPITIPIELPTTQIDELTIPVITEISSTSLTEAGGEKDPSTNPQPGPGTGLSPGQITEAISNALPETGSQLGDNVTNDTMGDPDGTKSAFITRFPFSIPWDIAKAINLLAAPPVTPRWEMDFMAPIASRVGGWRGDTTVVIDFGEYPIVGVVTRWFSTVMFLYGLAGATKRLMWPS